MEERQRPMYFNLQHDKDKAVVRLLHTGVKTMEKAKVHSIEVEGKKKKVKCLGDDCPLCKKTTDDKGKAIERLYIHLYDYTDNTDKVWDRTANQKFVDKLVEIENNWGKLSDVVLEITRNGDQFPQYDLTILPANKYQAVDEKLVDEKIGFRYYMNRKKEEIESYLQNGVFPVRPPYQPNQNQQQTQSQQQTFTPTTQPNVQYVVDDSDLPF